jgi:pimeloyl-ACP methyl ester carboxylesterase
MSPPSQTLLLSQWTRVEGLAIHARVSSLPAPAGRLPVVLVHGYGVSGAYFVPIAERLAAELPVYVPDLPGHGASDKPEKVLSVPELADALRSWMDAAGLERAAMVGNSMGCQIVADLAARFPERVARLALIGPTADPAARTLRRNLLPFLLTGFAERLSLVPLIAADYWRAGIRRMRLEMDYMFADRIEDKLPRIGVPSLVVRGSRDHLVPKRWTEEVARLLRTDRLFTIPGAGHALNYSAAGELARVLLPFLREGDLA